LDRWARVKYICHTVIVNGIYLYDKFVPVGVAIDFGKLLLGLDKLLLSRAVVLEVNLVFCLGWKGNLVQLLKYIWLRKLSLYSNGIRYHIG
jgi:hypothetical protein